MQKTSPRPIRRFKYGFSMQKPNSNRVEFIGILFYNISLSRVWRKNARPYSLHVFELFVGCHSVIIDHFMHRRQMFFLWSNEIANELSIKKVARNPPLLVQRLFTFFIVPTAILLLLLLLQLLFVVFCLFFSSLLDHLCMYQQSRI